MDQSVSLRKNEEISLFKNEPLSKLVVGLGWEQAAGSRSGQGFDLDASAFLLGPNDKVTSPQGFVFFNNLVSPNGEVVHLGDDLTGGDGIKDDEQITVDLEGVAPNIRRIVFVVSIYDSERRRQSFGDVRSAFIRVVNTTGGKEIARYDLREDAGQESAMIFAEIYRLSAGDPWKFKAVGDPYAAGLAGIATGFGLNVGAS